MLSLFALMICYNTYGQQPVIKTDTLITYDFLDSAKVPGDFLVLHNKKVQFRIKNVNRSLYNFTWEQTTNNYNTTPPAIFSTLNSTALPGEATTGEKEAAHGTSIKKTAFWTILDNYKKKAAFLDRLTIFQSTIGFLQKDCSNSFTAIRDIALEKTNGLLGEAETKSTYPEAIVALRELTTKNFRDLRLLYEELTKAYDTAQINVALAQRGKDKQQVTSLTEDLARMKESLAKATTINEAVVKFENTGGAEALATQLLNINESNFTVYSPIYHATGDDMTVSFSIDPKEALPCVSRYANFKQTMTGRVKGGWKFDFSTGLLLNFSFGDTKFFDQTYRLDSVPGDPTKKKIVQNSNKNITIPSIGALLHVYRRSGNGFNWGGTFGLSITNQTKLNYHLGMSGIIGNAQRIVLSSGLTLTQAKLISSQYKEGQQIASDVTLDPVPTDNFYRLGWFFAITYNLTGK